METTGSPNIKRLKNLDKDVESFDYNMHLVGSTSINFTNILDSELEDYYMEEIQSVGGG